MSLSDQYLRGSTLLTLFLFTACAPKFDENAGLTPPPPPKTECRQSLIQEASDFYKEILLYEFRPEVRAAEQLRYRQHSKAENIDYYYQISLIGERALKFKEHFVKSHCYLDPVNAKRFGIDFANVETQVRVVLSPLDDVANFKFRMDPLYSYNGISPLTCSKPYNPSNQEQLEPGKAAEYNLANSYVLSQFGGVTQILTKLRDDYNDYKDHNPSTYSRESVAKFLTLIKQSVFFCRAYLAIDSQNECSLKDPSLQKFCDKVSDLNLKMGVSDDNH